MKYCPKCQLHKNTEEFYKDKSRKDGLSYFCIFHHKQKAAAWIAENPAQHNISQKKHDASNKAQKNARTAKRRAAKINRTPKWLTEEHRKEIQEFYTIASELSWLSEEPLQVDHTIPLQGENISGLHVPWNLQILPKSINNSKNNKF